MSTLQAQKLAKRYVALLRQEQFSFSRVFLYGSYAKGKAHENSDIDICVVSPNFSGKNWHKMEQKLWYLRREIDERIAPVGIAPEEFNDVSPLAYEIRQTGVRIA